MYPTYFKQIWCVDFEFHAPPGERQEPLCMVAAELRSGRMLRLWRDELCDLPAAPFPVGDDSLIVAHYGSAEWGCFLTLGWQLPSRILDTYVEFRNLTNGLPTTGGAGLLGALTHYGLSGIASSAKDDMRQLAIRGGPYTDRERQALLDYCAEDVDALTKLLPAMWKEIDLPRALLRGRYTAAAARMEFAGVPIDVETLGDLRAHWDEIKTRIISEVDRQYGVFVQPSQQFDPHSTFGRG